MDSRPDFSVQPSLAAAPLKEWLWPSLKQYCWAAVLAEQCRQFHFFGLSLCRIHAPTYKGGPPLLGNKYPTRTIYLQSSRKETCSTSWARKGDDSSLLPFAKDHICGRVFVNYDSANVVLPWLGLHLLFTAESVHLTPSRISWFSGSLSGLALFGIPGRFFTLPSLQFLKHFFVPSLKNRQRRSPCFKSPCTTQIQETTTKQAL